MALSASAWNFWAIEAFSNGTEGSFSKSKRSTSSTVSSLQRRDEIIPPSTVYKIDSLFQQAFNLSLTEIAYGIVPNPFLGVSSASAYTQTVTDLQVVDGSEGGQTIPFWGQIQPARNSSFIIAWEDANDAHPYGWTNGTNLYNTYVAAKAAGLPFPIIPPVSNMIGNNYTSKPVFFGCDKKLTTTGDSRSPIVLYLANAPYSSYMNYSAGVNVMSPQQMNDIFVNSFNLVTQGNGTLDHEWPVCLGCAAIERSLEKAGMQTPEQCKRCFQKYCWDGKVVSGSNKTVDLSLVLNSTLGYAQWLEEHLYWNASLSYASSL
jgi:lysophospholipase